MHHCEPWLHAEYIYEHLVRMFITHLLPYSRLCPSSYPVHYHILLLPRTPLHCAVAYGHLEVIKLLVQNGGALYLETWCGDTALQIAMKECNDLHTQSSQDILQYLRGERQKSGSACSCVCVFCVLTRLSQRPTGKSIVMVWGMILVEEDGTLILGLVTCVCVCVCVRKRERTVFKYYMDLI